MKAFLSILAALLASSPGHAQNLLTNGDFEAGDTGFTSQYLSTPNLFPPETYAVLDNPKKGNGAFQTIGDHTTGSGLMLVVNGSTRNDAPYAWSETVAVVPGSLHTFSLWTTNLFGQNPSRFSIRINGVQVGGLIDVPVELGVWTQFSVEWDSGSADSAAIEIVFSSLSFGGNDTALDDLSFTGSPAAPCADPGAESPDPDELHTEVTVPGTSNPFLAGQPEGAGTKSDSAPDQSPVLATEVRGGDVLAFAVSGSVGISGGPTAMPTTPTDGSSSVSSASALGIAGYGSPAIPLNTLVGVFLNDLVPADPAPSQFTYPPEGIASEVFAPGLRQIFFIGDGLTGNGIGTRQQFVAPPGATRLFLGTTDGFGWFNNSGFFEVSICRLTSVVFGPELGPTTIRFDRDTYSIDLGGEATGTLMLDPVPLGGLYSQGLTITVRSEDGTLAGMVMPAASPVLDFDGPELLKDAETPPGEGVGGIKGSARFDFNRATATDPDLAAFSIANLPPGIYQLGLEPWNELGPTEDIFVTGRCLTLDPFISYGSATLEVIGALVPELTATGPITLQPQTGLLEQRLTVTNNTGRPLEGFRLFLTGLPDDVVAWNAHGEVDGIPYIDIFATLGVGESMEILLEYYRPSRSTDFVPTFTFDGVGSLVAPSDDAPLALDLRVLRKTNQGLLVEFLTEEDELYLIEYSDDMDDWKVSLPPVSGTGQRIQWFDRGQPKTRSFPAAARFYRIKKAPQP